MPQDLINRPPSSAADPLTGLPGPSSSKGKGNGLHAISRGLKSVINNNLGHELFLKRLKALQETTHQAIVGLSKCLGILQAHILNGLLFESSFSSLDFQLLGLDGHGIFQDVELIVSLDDLNENVPWYCNYDEFYCIVTKMQPCTLTSAARDHQASTVLTSSYSRYVASHASSSRQVLWTKKATQKEAAGNKSKQLRVDLKHYMDTLFWSLLDNKNSDVINHSSQALFQRSQNMSTKARVDGGDEAVEEEDIEDEMEQSK
ncbi:uncharacterized protein ATC70_002684 [Mucor velutinosus]|uniref:Uncharacterized protein n=1 Tax=Mucor velutinosus TaxID=708070 RepID=A0AAN7HMH8_9FUNG|nr:hypothetical protein ATC70_002684 [Mucor velutinosus]